MFSPSSPDLNMVNVSVDKRTRIYSEVREEILSCRKKCQCKSAFKIVISKRIKASTQTYT